MSDSVFVLGIIILSANNVYNEGALYNVSYALYTIFCLAIGVLLLLTFNASMKEGKNIPEFIKYMKTFEIAAFIGAGLHLVAKIFYYILELAGAMKEEGGAYTFKRASDYLISEIIPLPILILYLMKDGNYIITQLASNRSIDEKLLLKPSEPSNQLDKTDISLSNPMNPEKQARPITEEKVMSSEEIIIEKSKPRPTSEGVIEDIKEVRPEDE